MCKYYQIPLEKYGNLYISESQQLLVSKVIRRYSVAGKQRIINGNISWSTQQGTDVVKGILRYETHFPTGYSKLLREFSIVEIM